MPHKQRCFLLPHTMKFDIITIFPEIFDSYLKESLIKTAQEKGLLSIRVHDIRKYTNDPHKKVDDKPFSDAGDCAAKKG